jgi:hypothetical protein
MSRHDIDVVEWEQDGQIFNGGRRRMASRDDVQPKWLPIRKKDKMRSAEEMKPKAKRNHKKLMHRIKYEQRYD